MKVLVADDDPTSQLITGAALRSQGHECVTACDGSSAWDAVLSLHPDVVIADWVMPGLSGLELCQNIRGMASGEYPYVIMLTSKGSIAQALEGMHAGVDDYMIKPLDPHDLELRLIAAARVTAMHRRMARQRTELEVLNLELSSIARQDPLTGLGNRRALDEEFDKLDARVTRYGHRYSIALIDVDNFKSFNDRYGHQAGDEALVHVAGRLKAALRRGDAVYRYGGEEFLCVLPEHAVPHGVVAVERMRADVERLRITHAENPAGVLTISAGIALLDADPSRRLADVCREADEALYRAKRLGRNRVERGASELVPQRRG